MTDQKDNGTCRWKVKDRYYTDCQQDFSHEIDYLIENLNFCPTCGKKILFQEKTESEDKNG